MWVLNSPYYAASPAPQNPDSTQAGTWLFLLGHARSRKATSGLCSCISNPNGPTDAPSKERRSALVSYASPLSGHPQFHAFPDTWPTCASCGMTSNTDWLTIRHTSKTSNMSMPCERLPRMQCMRPEDIYPRLSSNLRRTDWTIPLIFVDDNTS